MSTDRQYACRLLDHMMVAEVESWRPSSMFGYQQAESDYYMFDGNGLGDSLLSLQEVSGFSVPNKKFVRVSLSGSLVNLGYLWKSYDDLLCLWSSFGNDMDVLEFIASEGNDVVDVKTLEVSLEGERATVLVVLCHREASLHIVHTEMNRGLQVIVSIEPTGYVLDLMSMEGEPSCLGVHEANERIFVGMSDGVVVEMLWKESKSAKTLGSRLKAFVFGEKSVGKRGIRNCEMSFILRRSGWLSRTLFGATSGEIRQIIGHNHSEHIVVLQGSGHVVYVSLSANQASMLNHRKILEVSLNDLRCFFCFLHDTYEGRF